MLLPAPYEAANLLSQNPNDPIAHACAFLALVPQALCITYATLIWSTREAEVALMFAGQLACEALNWILKRTIREERPHRMHLCFLFHREGRILEQLS